MVSVVKVGLIKPFNYIGLSRVVESILRSLDSMDIKKNFQIVALSHIKEPVNLVNGSIHAPFIWGIRL
jgi:hypothetical protein